MAEKTLINWVNDSSRKNKILGISVDKSTYTISGPDGVTTGTYGTYYVRIIEETAKLATELAKQYFTRYIFNQEIRGAGGAAVPFDAARKSELTRQVGSAVSAPIDKMSSGWLWEITITTVDTASLMNDPNSVMYITGSSTGGSVESSKMYEGTEGCFGLGGSIGNPVSHDIILQYKYPPDHPRRPDEIITAVGNYQRDTVMITFRMNYRASTKNPLYMLGLQNCLNSASWYGFSPYSVKINSISFKCIGTPSSRLSNDVHAYMFEFEFVANELYWTNVAEIIDPETGYPPADRGVALGENMAGVAGKQPGLSYYGARRFRSNPAFDFGLLFPSTSEKSIIQGAEDFLTSLSAT